MCDGYLYEIYTSMELKSTAQICRETLSTADFLTSPSTSFHSWTQSPPGKGRGTQVGVAFSEETVSSVLRWSPRDWDLPSLLSAFYKKVPPLCKYPLRPQGKNKVPVHLNSGFSSCLKRISGLQESHLQEDESTVALPLPGVSSQR